MRAVLCYLREPAQKYRCGLVFGTAYPAHRVFVFGRYEPGVVFAGTDLFSMQAQKDVPVFWENALATFPGWTFLGEGSRLSTPSFLDETLRHDVALTLVHLTLEEKTAQRRRDARGPQSDAWVRGVNTRINNLVYGYSQYSVSRPNETVEQFTSNVAWLQTRIEEELHAA